MTEEEKKKETPIYEHLGPGDCLIISKTETDILVARNEKGQIKLDRIPITGIAMVDVAHSEKKPEHPAEKMLAGSIVASSPEDVPDGVENIVQDHTEPGAAEETTAEGEDAEPAQEGEEPEPDQAIPFVLEDKGEDAETPQESEEEGDALPQAEEEDELTEDESEAKAGEEEETGE